MQLPWAPSLMLAVPFDMGGDDPESHARRALAVTLTTLTPNAVVLGFVPEPGLMLLHQIMPAKLSRMTINLGARP